jgi:phospholipase C
VPHSLRATNVGVIAIVIALVASSCSAGSNGASSSSTTSKPGASTGREVPGGPKGTYLVPAGIHKIQHVIIVQQENRSFDEYFGTFPRADGIPMKNGHPDVRRS